MRDYVEHGFTYTRFYRIYYGIKSRCEYPYKRYKDGYRWKWVKNQWKTFWDFKNDMYESYLDHCNKYWERNTSIDRIDNNWDYCKENCRWATPEVQTLNRSKTRTITVNWKEYNASTLAQECNIPTDTASWRITSYLKWKIKEKGLLAKWKIDQRSSVEIDWKTYYNKDIERITWLAPRTARTRMKDYIDWKITKEKLFRIKSK